MLYVWNIYLQNWAIVGVNVSKEKPYMEHLGMYLHMGLSENSVPLHPMVNDHYPY